MKTNMKSTIVVIGVVAEKAVQNRFGNWEVNVYTEGRHYDRVAALKSAPEVDKFIATLKGGESVQFSDCHLTAFVMTDKDGKVRLDKNGNQMVYTKIGARQAALVK